MTTIKRYEGSNSEGSWVTVAEIPIRREGACLELSVPRALLGLEGNALSFDMKWSDNAQELVDPISLCTHGDTAPNRRFNYRCIWNQ